MQLNPGSKVAFDCDNQQTVGLATKDMMKLITKL
jgi:hypothetical protein